jgi:hypothetical protein
MSSIGSDYALLASEKIGQGSMGFFGNLEHLLLGEFPGLDIARLNIF